MASSLIPGVSVKESGDKKKTSSASVNQANEGLAGGAVGVRRWAHRLLQRGQSTSSMPVQANGNLPAVEATTRSKTLTSLTAGMAGGAACPSTSSVVEATPPPLPPKTPRSKPVPPPRTSSCLSAGQTGPSARPSSAASAHHQDFIRYGNRSSPVTTALMMAQQAAAEALSYSASSTPAAVKSVRFGQQQQQMAAQQQTANETDRSGVNVGAGQDKDALAEATIGLEIAANLALAFARDVRRERMTESAAQPPSATSTLPAARPIRMPPGPNPPPPSAQRMATGHQEVTLSEFYQLLQFVGQARAVASAAPSGIVTSDPLPPPATATNAAAGHLLSSALHAGSITTAAGTVTTTTMAASAALEPAAGPRGVPSTSAPISSHAGPPPGYLTARSFRQQPSSGSPAGTSGGVTPPAKRTTGQQEATVDRCLPPVSTTRRSHSVEVNYDNYLMSSQRTPAPSATAYTSSCPSPSLPLSGATTLKTRSLPRCSHPPTTATYPPPPVASDGQTALAEGTAVPVQHWAEILALITQVLSHSGAGGGGGGGGGNGSGGDQYHSCPRQTKQQQQQQQQQLNSHSNNNNNHHQYQQYHPFPAGQDHHQQQPVTSQQQQAVTASGRRRRPGGGDSLSDSEEAYLRRRRQSAATAGQKTSPVRHYDSLRTPASTRPSSRASGVHPPPSGHHSYLASLSQRLQIEQYIVKTLTHLTKSTPTIQDGMAALGGGGGGGSDAGYIECWGSPERSRTPSNNTANSNIGLERALLRLDQRRTDGQPRIYQHHHWRITPAECNALFLCKVLRAKPQH